MKKVPSCTLIVCKGLSSDDFGAGRGTVFREMRPGAGFKAGDFVEEGWGGFRRTTPLQNTFPFIHLGYGIALSVYPKTFFFCHMKSSNRERRKNEYYCCT